MYGLLWFLHCRADLIVFPFFNAELLVLFDQLSTLSIISMLKLRKIVPKLFIYLFLEIIK